MIGGSRIRINNNKTEFIMSYEGPQIIVSHDHMTWLIKKEKPGSNISPIKI